MAAPRFADAVRRADAGDVPALTRMLVRAYMDDPVAVWMCRASGLRSRLLAGLYSGRLGRMVADGGVWTNAARSSGAVWMAPGCSQAGVRPNATLFGCALDPRLAIRLPLLAAGQRKMTSVHPRTPPHWYLSLLGTDPDAQGHGLGSAVLQPVLQQCDIDGVGAYLESSKPGNLDFYARFGFHVTGELQLPRGPKLWPMWREPDDDRPFQPIPRGELRT
jgi:GNAT superfamily N-acetyltransferase